MSNYTFLSTAMEAVRSTLETGLGSSVKSVKLEMENLTNYKQYPLCFVLTDSGNVKSNVSMNMNLHVIMLFHEHTGRNLPKTITDTMEKAIAVLREGHPNLFAREQFQGYLNQNVLDPFIGVELPLMAPLGGFRITYPNFNLHLQTNTT